MAFMAPLLVSMGASAATAATVTTVASYAGAAMTVLGGINSAQASNKAAAYNTSVAELNSQNSINAAKTNQNILEAKAVQEEAAGQLAARQKEHDLTIKLSRAQAVAAAQGGGGLQENLVSGLVERGETAAGYDLYSSTEKAKTLRYQGASAVNDAEAQGGLNVGAAKSKQALTESAANSTIIGSLGKASSMMSFAPGPAPGASNFSNARVQYSDALYDN